MADRLDLPKLKIVKTTSGPERIDSFVPPEPEQYCPAHPFQSTTVVSPLDQDRTRSFDRNPLSWRLLISYHPRPKSNTTDFVSIVLVRELIDPPGSYLPAWVNLSPKTLSIYPKVLSILAVAIEQMSSLSTSSVLSTK